MLMQTRLKSMSHYQSLEKLRPIRKHYLTAYPTGCSRTENTLRICHCFTFSNCKYLFKTGMLTLWSPVCSWCTGLWEQTGTTAAGTHNPAWQPQQRSRNVHELRHWAASSLGMVSGVLPWSFLLPLQSVRFKEMLLNVGLSHCCGAWLHRVQVNALLWFVPLAGLQPWYCCWALLKTSQHLVFWFIPFYIKILAEC